MSYSTRSPSMRTKALYVPIALLVTLIFFVFTPLPTSYDSNRDALVQQISGSAHSHISTITSTHAKVHNSGSLTTNTLETTKSKYAFATFLAGRDDELPYEVDTYFIAVRILAYQLLHAPETRSVDRSIPFIVLVTDKVPEHQRARLRQDGAIVVPADHLHADWIHASIPGWDDVLTKLRLWELTQFERICFLDGDMELLTPLDGVFSDSSVITQYTANDTSATKPDEARLPATFSFAGIPELAQEHNFPPTEAGNDYPNIGYLNAGFFVFAPSLDMLDYYKSVLAIPERFDGGLPEQNLLNYAHRQDGNMPWTQLDSMWNIHYPVMRDVEGGVKSIHEKWWTSGEMGKLMLGWRWRMEGFFEARDSVLESQTERWTDAMVN